MNMEAIHYNVKYKYIEFKIQNIISTYILYFIT